MLRGLIIRCDLYLGMPIEKVHRKDVCRGVESMTVEERSESIADVAAAQFKSKQFKGPAKGAAYGRKKAMGFSYWK